MSSQETTLRIIGMENNKDDLGVFRGLAYAIPPSLFFWALVLKEFL